MTITYSTFQMFVLLSLVNAGGEKWHRPTWSLRAAAHSGEDFCGTFTTFTLTLAALHHL